MLWKSTPEANHVMEKYSRWLWESTPEANNVMEKNTPRSTSPGSAPESVVRGSTSPEGAPEAVVRGSTSGELFPGGEFREFLLT